MARVIGAALISLGVLLWFAKDAEGAAQKNLGIAALAGSVVGVIVTSWVSPVSSKDLAGLL